MPDRSHIYAMVDELAELQERVKFAAPCPAKKVVETTAVPDSWDDGDDGVLDFLQGAMRDCRHVVHLAPTAAYVKKIDYVSHAVMAINTPDEVGEFISLPTLGNRSMVGLVKVCTHTPSDCQCVRQDKDLNQRGVSHKTNVAWVLHKKATSNDFRRVNRGDVVIGLVEGPATITRDDGVVFSRTRPRGCGLPIEAGLYVACDSIATEVVVEKEKTPVPERTPMELRAEQLALRIPLDSSRAQKTKSLVESVHSLSRAFDVSVQDARAVVAREFKNVRSEAIRCRGLAVDDEVYLESLLAEPALLDVDVKTQVNWVWLLSFVAVFSSALCWAVGSVAVGVYFPLIVPIQLFVFGWVLWQRNWFVLPDVVAASVAREARDRVVDALSREAVGQFSDGYVVQGNSVQ